MVDGLSDGSADGATDGDSVTAKLGDIVGSALGDVVGVVTPALGASDGTTVGTPVNA